MYLTSIMFYLSGFLKNFASAVLISVICLTEKGRDKAWRNMLLHTQNDEWAALMSANARHIKTVMLGNFSLYIFVPHSLNFLVSSSFKLPVQKLKSDKQPSIFCRDGPACV